jgi:hypothetical protein
MRDAELRRRLDALYREYDHRFVDPDPLQFVRAEKDAPAQEVMGLIASALAYGAIGQIKRSIARHHSRAGAAGDGGPPGRLQTPLQRRP